jgi:hypothetical protein
LELPHTAFSVEDYDVPGSIVQGADLLVTSQGDVGFEESEEALPINVDYTIEYYDDTLVTVNANTFRVNVPYSVESYNEGVQVLRLDIQEQIPVNGQFAFTLADWTEGSTFSMKYTPKNFPYDRVFDLVTKQQDYLKILAKYDLEDPFFNVYSKREKLAVIVVGLINDTYAISKS